MLYKTTAKAIRNYGGNVVKAGYCELQTLLRDESRTAYASGVYGWNFDVYEVCGVTICTGYRGMPGRRANNCAEYERRAQELENKHPRFADYDELRKARRELLEEFCKQA